MSWREKVVNAVAWAAVLSLIVSTVAQSATPAPTRKPTEFEVKAAYLYNFGKFIKWPAATPDPFPVCVLGRDPFGDTLDATLQGEKIDGKSLAALRIATAHESAACRIVYVSPSEEKRLKEVIASLQKSSALTVSDIPGFVNAGGMIEFVSEGGRIRFQVNLAAAQHAGLTLSSELLKVATSVKTEPAGGS